MLSHRPLELHLDLDLVPVDLDFELGAHAIRDMEAHRAGPERELGVIAAVNALESSESSIAASSRLSDSLRSTFTSDMTRASPI